MKTPLAAVAALSLTAAACATAHHPASPQEARAAPAPEPSATAGGRMQGCPMAVPGTQVAASDVPSGEAITFTTSPDHVQDLRARVHAMADMHDRRHAGTGAADLPGATPHGGAGGGTGGGASGGMMGGTGGGPGGMRVAMPPPSSATVDDVDGGARIVVTPNDPADLDRLRAAVRMHALHMQETGACGMGAPAPR